MSSDDTRARANEEENHSKDLYEAADRQEAAEQTEQEASDAKEEADKDAENA